MMSKERAIVCLNTNSDSGNARVVKRTRAQMIETQLDTHISVVLSRLYSNDKTNTNRVANPNNERPNLLGK